MIPLTGVRGAAIPLWAAVIGRIFPEKFADRVA
jgi:hypothetical protein